jgi:hypothetical protein
MSKWRTGRKVGRTLYIGDNLVGLMDTPELAELVATSVNEIVRIRALAESQVVRDRSGEIAAWGRLDPREVLVCKFCEAPCSCDCHTKAANNA